MPDKILLVDDDVDTLRLVGLMLQRQGYQIIAANNGQQALLLAQSENPDLILLDIMMPDIDGYEVTSRLRENPSTSAIPIIMFTAKNQMDDKVTGFEVGADDYLSKPTQPRELVEHIRAVLSHEKKIPTGSTFSASRKNRGYTIGILSAKGGLGVSTFALNLGICLQRQSEREVTIAEFRPGEGDIALMLGSDNPMGLNNLLGLSPKDISPAHISSELISHMYNVKLLMASYVPDDARLLTHGEHFVSIMRHLGNQSDYIVIDLGPSLPPISQNIISACDELIVLVESNPTTIIRTQMLIDDLKRRGFGEGRLHVVLYNRQRIDNQSSLAWVQQELRYPVSTVFTAVPELILQATVNGVPLVILNPDNIASQQFVKLAESVSKRVHVRE